MAHEWAYCQRCGHAHPRRRSCEALTGRELLCYTMLFCLMVFLVATAVTGLAAFLDWATWR